MKLLNVAITVQGAMDTTLINSLRFSHLWCLHSSVKALIKSIFAPDNKKTLEVN